MKPSGTVLKHLRTLQPCFVSLRHRSHVRRCPTTSIDLRTRVPSGPLPRTSRPPSAPPPPRCGAAGRRPLPRRPVLVFFNSYIRIFFLSFQVKQLLSFLSFLAYIYTLEFSFSDNQLVYNLCILVSCIISIISLLCICIYYIMYNQIEFK